MAKKFNYEAFATTKIVVIAGQEKDGTVVYLDSYGTWITPNLGDAMHFSSLEQARTYYKNYTLASILIGNTRLQLLDRVIEATYTCNDFTSTLLDDRPKKEVT